MDYGMATTYPMRHISIRVPWHGTSWEDRVCAMPHFNGLCLKLKRIAEEKDDYAEKATAGKSLNELPQEKWPCRFGERMTFTCVVGTTTDWLGTKPMELPTLVERMEL